MERSAAVSATCVKAHYYTTACPYASCIDRYISHSIGTRAGPVLVGGGGCSCMLLHKTPNCDSAGPDLQLALVVFLLPSTSANTLHLHMQQS